MNLLSLLLITNANDLLLSRAIFLKELKTLLMNGITRKEREGEEEEEEDRRYCVITMYERSNS